jgi:hypothetical protein
MATTLESWDTMTQLQNARRRAIVVVVAVAAILVAAVFVGIRLWPDNGSPSGETAKGPDLTWEPAITGIELPVSRTAGPKSTAGGRAMGFQRSSLGAALAATHLTYRTIPEAGSAVFEPTIRQQVTGDNVEKMLARVTQEYESERTKQGVAAGRALAPGAGRPLAYKVTSYVDTQANVSLFAGFATDATKFFAFDLQVLWIDGDWRLVAPPEGNVGNKLTQLTAIPQDAVSLVESG